MTKDELKDKIIEILKRRVQNLIASDLISPFFWEDFADEIMNKEQQLATSETQFIDETDNSPHEIIFNGRTYTRK